MARTTLEAELIAIGAQLEFHSESEFRFAQQACSVHHPRWSLPAHAYAAPRERLVHAVSLALYYGAYCRRGEKEVYVVPNDLDPAAEFVENLSRANQTQRMTEHGWELVHHDANNLLHVAKAGRFRASEPHQAAAAIGNGSRTESLFSLSVRREDRDAMPMFYFAHSETLPNQCDDMDNVRFYFHCDQQSVFRVMQSVTASLNAHCVPFRIKCCNHPRLYGRSDALVLYVEKRYVQFVARNLILMSDRGEFQLVDGEPLFSKRLITGIGIAEDPGDGQSFGQHRCRLLAEALVDAHDSGCLHGDGVLIPIDQRFCDAGLDLRRPHLNPGSVDWYQFPEVVVPPNAGGSRQRDSHKALLHVAERAAERIGRLLVRDAIWADDVCNWLSQSERTSDTNSQTIVKACSRDLADGICGIGLFLARLFAVNHDPLIVDVVAGISRLLILAIDDEKISPDEASALLEMTSTVGLTTEHRAALDRLARWNDPPKRPPRISMTQKRITFGSGSPVGLAQDQIRRWESEPARYACFGDPIVGDDFLQAWVENEDDTWLEAARRIADHVLEKTEQHDQPWWSPMGREYPPLGLADGLAGMGHFLLRLSRPRELPPLSE